MTPFAISFIKNYQIPEQVIKTSHVCGAEYVAV